MENIISKENGFIYKGEFYSLNGGSLTICEEKILINMDTNEEYTCINELPIDNSTFTVKTKYGVTRGWNNIEVFETREEAEEFIAKAIELIVK